MFDPERLLGQLLSNGMGGSFGSDKHKRKQARAGKTLLGSMSTGTKMKVGMGVLGLAVAAFEHFRNQQKAAAPPPLPPTPGGWSATPPPPLPSATPPPLPAAEANPRDAAQRDAVLLIQAMIAAAAADGLIDDAERERIVASTADAGLDEETQRFLVNELEHPKSLAAVAGATRAELAADVYAASCMAITLDTEAERVYLDTLAARLVLSAETRAAVHQQLEIG
jgi:uncharacterized membrane protein YebE (DUF533 family)